MFVIIAVIINFAALFLIFHYFRWKMTSYSFLEGYEKKKEEISSEIDMLLVEINRTTERNLQLLEAKISQLNDVVKKSEKVFSAIKKEIETSDNTGEIYRKLEKMNRNDLNSQAAQSEKNVNQCQDDKEDKKNGNSMMKQEIRDKVITMYKNGIDIELISRNLGITSGEAELIISISKIK